LIRDACERVTDIDVTGTDPGPVHATPEARPRASKEKLPAVPLPALPAPDGYDTAVITPEALSYAGTAIGWPPKDWEINRPVFAS
jgi:hypothetical protein